MQGFGNSFWCILYSPTQKAYHIERFCEYLAHNRACGLSGILPEYVMIDGLYSAREDVDKAFKEITEPELVMEIA